MMQQFTVWLLVLLLQSAHQQRQLAQLKHARKENKSALKYFQDCANIVLNDLKPKAKEVAPGLIIHCTNILNHNTECLLLAQKEIDKRRSRYSALPQTLLQQACLKVRISLSKSREQ